MQPPKSKKDSAPSTPLDEVEVNDIPFFKTEVGISQMRPNIIFGMIFGYIILKEIPTLNMIIGAIIITLSGMFVIKRQKDLGKIE